MKRALSTLLILAGIATALLAVVAPEPAHAWAHENYRWKYRTVCVIDHTGSKWPVHSATYRWSKVPDLTYRYGGTCPQKVRVYAGYYGRTGWHGWTNCSLWSTRGNWEWLGDTYRSYRCTVKLNNTYRPSGWGDRRSLIMHELGHTAGLEHTSSSALMNTSKWRWYNYPTYDDKRGVERRYPW